MLVAKEENALKADGLVSTKSDAHAQVMHTHNLHQPGILQAQTGISLRLPLTNILVCSMFWLFGPTIMLISVQNSDAFFCIQFCLHTVIDDAKSARSHEKNVRESC